MFVPYRSCTKLTGITRDMVKDGMKVTAALAELDAYVAEHLQGHSFCVVTDGVWDLQIQLYAESLRKGFAMPAYLQRFLDIKSEFLKFYPWFPKNFRASLKQLLQSAYGLLSLFPSFIK
jgi:inhibitor of KinA sporulation pathway (predicted exonuclease)